MRVLMVLANMGDSDRPAVWAKRQIESLSELGVHTQTYLFKNRRSVPGLVRGGLTLRGGENMHDLGPLLLEQRIQLRVHVPDAELPCKAVTLRGIDITDAHDPVFAGRLHDMTRMRLGNFAASDKTDFHVEKKPGLADSPESYHGSAR